MEENKVYIVLCSCNQTPLYMEAFKTRTAALGYIVKEMNAELENAIANGFAEKAIHSVMDTFSGSVIYGTQNFKWDINDLVVNE